MELTIPCDDRFRPVLSLLCQRMSRYVGYSGTEAEEVAAAVVHATDGVLVHGASQTYKDLDVTIATSESDHSVLRPLPVWPRGAVRRRPRVVAHLLSEHSGDEAPLDAIHRVMSRVEFGKVDGVEFCTLSKSLPEEPSPKPRTESSPES